MEAMPLITVIVPIYNTEKYLAGCVDSILAQTYSNLEILLVNDGSKDHSAELCRAYVANDSRVQLLEKENGGLASARNYGMARARGQYIGFVDSDDRVEPDTYEKLYRAIADKPDYISMCGRYNVEEATGKKTPHFTFSQAQQWDREESIRRFLTWDHMDTAVCDKLFPAQLIRGMEFPGTLVSEDMLFTFGVLQKAQGVVHIGEPKYHYLQRTGSLSNSDYNPKSKGQVLYPEQIYAQVCQVYPQLRQAGEYYYFSRVLVYIHLLQRCDVRDPAQNAVLRRNLKKIWKNPNFSRSEKIRSTLAAVHLLKPVHGLYCRLRGIAQ